MKESSHKSNVLVLVFVLQTLIWFRVRGLAASAGRPIHAGDIISPECPRSAPGSPPGWTGAPYPSLINANAKSRVIHQGLTRSFSHTCIIIFLLFLNFPLFCFVFFASSVIQSCTCLQACCFLSSLSFRSLLAVNQPGTGASFFPCRRQQPGLNQAQLCLGS